MFPHLDQIIQKSFVLQIEPIQFLYNFLLVKNAIVFFKHFCGKYGEYFFVVVDVQASRFIGHCVDKFSVWENYKMNGPILWTVWGIIWWEIFLLVFYLFWIWISFEWNFLLKSIQTMNFTMSGELLKNRETMVDHLSLNLLY